MTDLQLLNPRPLWQRYLAVTVYLLISMLLVIVLGVIIAWLDPASFSKTSAMPFRAIAYGVGLQIFGFVPCAYFLLKFSKIKGFSFRRTRMRDIAICCTLILLSNFTFGILYHFFNIEPKQLGFLDPKEVLANKYAFIALTALAVPIYEEWVFRGIIFGVLVNNETSVLNILSGAFFCAFLFTVAHLEGRHSISALPPILAMAAIFQYMTWKSKSIWPSIFGHALQNLLASIGLIAKLTAAAKAI